MSKIIGRNCDVAISAAGAVYTDIGNIKSAELSRSDDMADCTDNDSAGWKEELPADAQVTLSITANYNDADAGQLLMFAHQWARAQYYYRVRPEASTGEKEFIFQANMPDMNLPTETGSVEELSASLNSTGAVTKQDQT